jgi:quercetin dioxygenase-like cupin family protein
MIIEAPMTGQPDKTFALYSLEWPPGSTFPLHSHPGDEYGTVIKGSLAVKQIDGQSQIYTTGQGFRVPAGVVHEYKTTVGTTTIHAFVLQKGKGCSSYTPNRNIQTQQQFRAAHVSCGSTTAVLAGLH